MILCGACAVLGLYLMLKSESQGAERKNIRKTKCTMFTASYFVLFICSILLIYVWCTGHALIKDCLSKKTLEEGKFPS